MRLYGLTASPYSALSSASALSTSARQEGSLSSQQRAQILRTQEHDIQNLIRVPDSPTRSRSPPGRAGSGDSGLHKRHKLPVLSVRIVLEGMRALAYRKDLEYNSSESGGGTAGLESGEAI
jgi:hypothetical protein